VDSQRYAALSRQGWLSALVAMPRLRGGPAAQSLFVAGVGDGVVRVVAEGRTRRLLFINTSGEARLQTEVVCQSSRPDASCDVDVGASLRRTPYLRCMARRLMDICPRHVLLLGLGGGLLASSLRCSHRVEAVECSPLVVELAGRFFGVEGVPGGPLVVHNCDAEHFVLGQDPTARPVFDACAIDLFVGHSQRLPEFVLSERFHSALRALLVPGARVVQNALAYSGDIVQEEKWARSRSRPHDAEVPQRGSAVRCFAWCRGAAPRGPLRTAAFPRRNESAQQLERLIKTYKEVFGNAKVHRPCAWDAGRVVEVDVY